MMQTFSLLGLG